MRRPPNPLLLSLLACLVVMSPAAIAVGAVGAVGAVVVAEDEPVFDRSQVEWSRLTYKASKFFLTATTQVELAYEAPAPDTLARLSADPASEIQPTGDDLAVITLRSRFLGKDSTDRVWLDSTSARGLQRKKLESGKSKYRKTIRYGRSGIQTRRASPRGPEEQGAIPEDWSEILESNYEYPQERGGGTVTAPAGLFYILAASRLETGQKLEIYASSGAGLARLEIEAHGSASLRTKYRKQSGEAGEAHHGAIETQRLTIKTHAVDPSGADFEFLGLKGDLEIYLDPETRVPMQVSGKARSLGRVDVKLTEMILR